MQKNEWVAQTKESDTILRSMNACFILINSDLGGDKDQLL